MVAGKQFNLIRASLDIGKEGVEYKQEVAIRSSYTIPCGKMHFRGLLLQNCFGATDQQSRFGKQNVFTLFHGKNTKINTKGALFDTA
jgi:hypothetical protein